MSSSTELIVWRNPFSSIFKIPRFVHEPLKSSGSIRLVRVRKKRHYGIMLWCEISDHDVRVLNRMPSYYALSYTWGTDPAREEIMLNGKLFNLSRTLYDFMSLFVTLVKVGREDGASAQDDFTDYLWIDQLCIDQGDHREKGQQVGKMASVYSGAEQVIIWLDRRFECPFDSMLDHPYWERLWIVQEIVLAQHRTFFYGAHELSPDAVYTIIWNNLDLLKLSWVRNHREIWTPTNITVGCPSLGLALTRYSNRSCKDPRDKVYGLLALGPESTVRVDYSKSVHDVFCDVVSELELQLFQQNTSQLKGGRASERAIDGMMALFHNMILFPNSVCDVDGEDRFCGHADYFLNRYHETSSYRHGHSDARLVLRKFFARKQFCMVDFEHCRELQDYEESGCECFDWREHS